MMATWWHIFSFREERTAFLFLCAVAILSFFFLPIYNVVNPDTSFMAWAAQQMLSGAVFGRDILEVNPPLCVLIYVPAAILGEFATPEWGVRIWLLLLTIASIFCLWQTAGKTLRVPVIIVVLLFATFAFPNYFAEREQIVFLLCAPYVAGFAKDRRWSILTGIMAGVGFMMKPYFLIPLALICIMRRRIGTEERAIVGSGIIYAIVLLVFFRPYIYEMVPAAMATYWAVSFPREMLLMHSAFIVFLATPTTCIGIRTPQTLSYLLATLGFTVSAFIQQKGFIYHFMPAYGFLAIYLVVGILLNKPRIAVMSAFLLCAELAMIWRLEVFWRKSFEQGDMLRSVLQAEVDKAGSFMSLVPEAFAAFPAATRSPSKYVGMGIGEIFIPAVAKYATGLSVGNQERADELARSQALRELGRKPQLVITLKDDYDVEGRPFDILDWLKRDPRFDEEWKNYSPYRTVGQLLLFHRK